jgi:hypothetical protein
MKRSLIDGVCTELALQLRSRWLLALVVLFLAASIGGAMIPHGFVKSSAPLIADIQSHLGSDFSTWLLESEESQMFRNDIYAAHPKNAVNSVLTVIGALGTMILSVWGAYVVGSEFSQRTAHCKAAHYGWWESIKSKLIVIAVVTIAITLFSLIVGITASNISWHFLKGSCTWIDIPIADVPVNIPAGIIAVVLGIGFYGIVAAVAALLAKNMALGIIIGLAIPYIESFAKQWWLPQGAYANLLVKAMHYYDGSAAVSPVVSTAPAAFLPWLVMAIWLVMLVVFCRYAAKTQEIS